jgi:hypothetical protein
MALVGCVLLGSPSSAMDLSGLWATDASVCGKVFMKHGDQMSFAEDSDIYGSGFVIEGSRVRGQMANCSIKARKQDGDVVHLILACASDIMLQNVQVSLKVVDDNSITRLFPGMPDMHINYARCSL